MPWSPTFVHGGRGSAAAGGAPARRRATTGVRGAGARVSQNAPTDVGPATPLNAGSGGDNGAR